MVSSNGLKSPQMSMYVTRSQDENSIDVKQSTACKNSSNSYTIQNNYLKDTTNLTNIQRENKQNEKSVYNHYTNLQWTNSNVELLIKAAHR